MVFGHIGYLAGCDEGLEVVDLGLQIPKQHVFDAGRKGRATHQGQLYDDAQYLGQLGAIGLSKQVVGLAAVFAFPARQHPQPRQLDEVVGLVDDA